jgi:exodeoxyribonuclease VII large subunit
VGRLAARVTALSPEATLQRGYAVLQKADGTAVRSPDDVAAGEALSARVAAGRVPVTVDA